MITTYVIWFVTLLFGYVLGRNSSSSPQEGITAGLKRGLDFTKTAFELDLKPGPIRRPTAKQLAKRNEPEKARQAKEATKEALDQIPELQQAKKKVETMKIEGTWIP